MLSEIARAVFPSSSALGFMYWAVQVLTLAVLVLAANTSYQGFPRLAALLARDRFFPRQFTNLGDRLVFSNGIVVLTGDPMRAALGLQRERRLADPPLRDRGLHRLHAVAGRDGALLAADAASPAGGVEIVDQRHRRHGDRASSRVIVIWTKFAEGAWLVTVAIPLLVADVPRHQPALPPLRPQAQGGHRRGAGGGTADERGLLAVEAIDVATEGALWYSRQILGGCKRLRALHRPGRHTDPGIRPRWFDFAEAEPRLEMLPTNEGRMQAMLEEVWGCRVESRTSSRWSSRSSSSAAHCCRRRVAASFRLKLRLLSEPGVVVTDVPAVTRAARPGGPRAQAPGGSRAASRTSTRAPLRALDYARVARRRGHAGRLVRDRRAKSRQGASRSARSGASRCPST